MTYLLIGFLLSLTMLIHEAGHYFAARYLGIPVARFSIGLGPVLWKKEYAGTTWCISLIPVGGYVLPDVASDMHWLLIPRKKRALFTLAGPAFNLLFALPLFALLNSLMQGPSISGCLIQPPLQTLALCGQLLESIPLLFQQPEEAVGIVGLLAQIGAGPQPGLLHLLVLFIVLNLNIGIFNLLPFPPLDGGKLLLYGLEVAIPRSAYLQLPISLAGWAVLILAMIAVTIHDLSQWDLLS